MRSALLGRGHPLDEQALAALAGLDGRAAVAPAADQFGGVQAKARLLPDRPVAARAPRGQDRLDVARVIDRVRGQNTWQPQGECHDRRLEFHSRASHESRLPAVRSTRIILVNQMKCQT